MNYYNDTAADAFLGQLIFKLRAFRFKKENLLWMTPIIISFVLFGMLNVDSIDVLIGHTYINISNIMGATVCILALLYPYILHIKLRQLPQYNKTITSIHIFITIIVLVSLPLLFHTTPQVMPVWDARILPPPSYEVWEINMLLATSLMVVGAVCQLLFIGYAQFKIKVSKNP